MDPRATPRSRSRRRRLAAALALLGLACLAVALGGMLTPSSRDAALDTSSQLERALPTLDGRPPVARRHTSTTRRVRKNWPQQPRPVRLVIPAIGVSAPVIRLGRNGDGTAQTPRSARATGWFAPGPEPGERGAAVVIGHVDSRRGPGVFYHLRALARGDRITVVLRGTRRLRFVVTGAREAAKSRFPTNIVFARTDRPTLRLVTCGGRFDRSTRHYVDNYIVFAHLAGRA